MSKSGIIYWFKCPHADCHEEHIGESGRTFGGRLREHYRAPSPIYQHSQTTGHPVDLECFTVVDRESPGPLRKPCTTKLMTHPSTGTWGNTSFSTYQVRYYRTLLHCGSCNSAPPPLPFHNGSKPPYHITHVGNTKFLPFGKYGPILPPPTWGVLSPPWYH